MASKTVSSRLRDRGNTYYKEGVARDLTDADRASRLDLARKLYNKALETGIDLGDIASAHKNIAAVISAQIDGGSPEDRLALYCESFEHRCRSLVVGSDCGLFTKEWINDVKGALYKCMRTMLKEAVDQLTKDAKQVPAVLRILLRALTAIPDQQPELQLRFTCKMIDNMHAAAQQVIQPASANSDWRSCLYMLAELKRPLLEALQLAVESRAANEAQDLLELEEELFAIQCRCESAQVRNRVHGFCYNCFLDAGPGL